MTKEEAITRLKNMAWLYGSDEREQNIEAIDMAVEALKTVQKHEETFEWCNDCKEYDKENHCCHRWSKVIRQTRLDIEDEMEVVSWEDEMGIVQCKDCKHWYSDADTGMACEFTNMSQPEDGYCNWGERREP